MLVMKWIRSNKHNTGWGISVTGKTVFSTIKYDVPSIHSNMVLSIKTENNKREVYTAHHVREIRLSRLFHPMHGSYHKMHNTFNTIRAQRSETDWDITHVIILMGIVSECDIKLYIQQGKNYHWAIDLK